MTQPISLVNQTFQWGTEPSAGAGGTADRKFSQLVVTPKLAGDLKAYRAQAVKGVSSTSRSSDETTNHSFEGPWDFNDLCALYANSGHYAAPSAPDTNGAVTWLFAPSLIAVNVPKTFVAAWGGPAIAKQAAYVVTHKLNFEANRGGLKVSGEMLGRGITDLVGGLAANPTIQDPMTCDHLATDVYLEDDYTVLSGGTAVKLGRAYKATIDISDLWKPDSPMDSASSSYTDVVEGDPKYSVKLTVMADAAGYALLATMRTGATKYLRLSNKGPLIGGTVFYLHQLDVPLKITKYPNYEDVDPIRGITIEGEIADSVAFGHSMYKAKIINKLAAL